MGSDMLRADFLQALSMAKKSTRDNLVANVRWLMSETGWTQVELAERSGVSQTAISKVLRGDMVPTIEFAEKLASAFGLSGWHIIMPDLPGDLLRNGTLEKLFRDFIASSESGRQFISQVANREAAKPD